MSEFDTLADLFPEDRQPTRELEPIQKVDRTDQIESDIDEFYETESAKRVLRETSDIVANDGVEHRFRYVHATFGSGKSHLLKLIGVATGELEGLESYAHELANTTTGFKEFRESIAESHIDHLQPLFLNLLDRDRDETKLPLILFEELGRRRGYHTSLPWLLEFCWQLDVEHGLWDQLEEFEHEGLRLAEVVDRPASLRPWLKQAIPQLPGASAAGLDTAQAVDNEIDDAEETIDPTAFTPNDLVERLVRTKQHLERDGDTYQYLIGLDEIAIYVGDQQRRYEEVVDTVTALIDGLNPPILGTGQWPMRDMQQNFIGDVDDEAWYAQEVELEGADTETIVRKRWLQKSTTGSEYIESDLLADASLIEPRVSDDANPPGHNNPAEAYPFRDLDLWLLRDSMQGLIEGDRDTDRDYIQGRALLARVRSLFVKHGWANRSPGAIVPWDAIYDIIEADTELISGWASNLITRVENTLQDELATRTAKALFLLSQVETVPRTPQNLTRLLIKDVSEDIGERTAEVTAKLEALAERNLIRESTDAEETTYTILSEEDIQFWQEVQKEATELPEHQVQNNIQEFIHEADPRRLPSQEGTQTGEFGDLEGISYTVRYSVDRSIPNSVTDEYNNIVLRLLVHDASTLRVEREQWQDEHSGPTGREDVLVTVELTETIRRQVRQLIGMKAVMGRMADPDPDHRLQRQSMQEEVEDELRDRLDKASVYLPQREAAYGSYLEELDNVVTTAVKEKFPQRKNIHHTLQLDDLQELIDFFQEDGAWPLTEHDAEILGVNPVPRTISNGWAMEFLELDRFDDENQVSADRILETINGRGGEFLGTPDEALHTLLFVLVGANKIGLRVDGARVTDTHTIARTITRSTLFEDAIIVFDPSPPPEDLSDLYEALVGDEPDTDDTQTLLEELEDWVNQNASEFKTVVSRTHLEFEGQLTLDDLDEAIEPAVSGEELDADRLTNDHIITQAERYAEAAPLFTTADGEEEPIWNRFTATYEWLSDNYQTAEVTREMAVSKSGSQIPTVDTLESQLERAQQHRVEVLQELYYDLMGEPTPDDELTVVRETLTDALGQTSLIETVDTVSETYPNVTFDKLHSVIDMAETTDEPLAEEVFATSEFQSDLKTLANGRALLEVEVDGESLHAQLTELDAELADDSTNFVAQQIRQAVSGTNIPDSDRAQQLLKQGRVTLAGDDDEDDDGDEGQQLWHQISTHDEGTIVVIDMEESQ